MINPFMHSNQVNLTGIVEITADIIKLMLNENNETTIADIKDLFFTISKHIDSS